MKAFGLCFYDYFFKVQSSGFHHGVSIHMDQYVKGFCTQLHQPREQNVSYKFVYYIYIQTLVAMK